MPDNERFVFALPLKPRAACKDWEEAQENLRRTIRSARNAAGPEASLIAVACHDHPDLRDVDGPDVCVLKVPFAAPASPSEGTRDKSRKRRFIGAWLRAKAETDSFCVMFLDADDLVHRALVHVTRTDSAPSFLVDDGYVFDTTNRVLLRRRTHFHRSCGSSFICRFRADELPSAWEDDASPFGQFGSSPDQRGHQDYDIVARELDKPPQTVSFPAVVYFANHAESLWASKGRAPRRASDPREIVWGGRARHTLRYDFSAPDLAECIGGVPAAASAIGRATLAAARARLRRSTPVVR